MHKYNTTQCFSQTPLRASRVQVLLLIVGLVHRSRSDVSARDPNHVCAGLRSCIPSQPLASWKLFCPTGPVWTCVSRPCSAACASPLGRRSLPALAHHVGEQRCGFIKVFPSTKPFLHLIFGFSGPSLLFCRDE